MNLKVLGMTCAIIAMTCGTNAANAADVFNEIIANGKISVGVAAGYKPYGFINEKGEMVGLTHDLLADMMTRLNKKAGKKIELEKVSVTAQNRFQFLQQGRIDMILSTVSVTPERKKIVDMIEPGFYAAGVVVVAKKEYNIKNWGDLKGKTLCTQQGAFYNKPTAEAHNLNLEPYATAPEQSQALLDGRCYASLDDESHAAAMLSDGNRYAGFEMPLPAEMVTPWALTINKGNPKMHAFLEEVNAIWLKEGIVKASAKKWGIPPIKWLDDHSPRK